MTEHQRTFHLKAVAWTGEKDEAGNSLVNVWRSGKLTQEELKEDWVDCENGKPASSIKFEKSVCVELMQEEVDALLKGQTFQMVWTPPTEIIQMPVEEKKES